MRHPKHVMRELANRAILANPKFWSVKRSPSEMSKPGTFYEKFVSPEDKELIKNLKSNDNLQDRFFYRDL